MKKNLKAVIILFLLVATGLALWSRRADKVTVESRTVRNSTKKSLSAEAKKFAGLSATIHEPALINECEIFNDTITHQSLETSIYDFEAGSLLIPSACPLKDKSVNALYEELISKCADGTRKEKPADCTNALFMYRAAKIDSATAKQNVKDLATDVLVQKFFGLLFSNALGERNEQARALIEELRARLPDSPGVDRMEIMRLLAAKDFGHDPTITAAITKARASDPDDTSLYEVQLIDEQQNNYDTYSKGVQAQYSLNPDNAIAVYHMGCVEWHNGRQAQALIDFEHAVTLLPSDTRFAKTLNKAKTAALGAAVCEVTLGVNPDQI